MHKETLMQFPFPVTTDDSWVSLPLEGLTCAVLTLGVYQHTRRVKSPPVG
jgi:hypothetical protein